MSAQYHGWYIVAPFLVCMTLVGVGTGALYLIRTFSHPRDIEEERGLAGFLMIAAFASFLLAFVALAIGIYALVVHWIR